MLGANPDEVWFLVLIRKGRDKRNRISAVLEGTHERDVRETGENHSICKREMRMNTVAGFMGFCLDTGEEPEEIFG